MKSRRRVSESSISQEREVSKRIHERSRMSKVCKRVRVNGYSGGVGDWRGNG